MTWTPADMAEVDRDPANRRTRDPMRHDPPTPKGESGPVRRATPHELADYAARLLREVPLERARLAVTDPEGEPEAVAPLSPVRARQVLLEAAEAEARRSATAAWQSRHRTARRRDHLESGRDLLSRLGADPARARGVMRCPAHEDRSPSLSWRLTADGRALLHCHAGCTFAAILEAVA